MPRNLPVLTLAFCSFLSVFARSAVARDLIPAGTILQCTIDEPNFSSKTAMVGDPLLCHLSSLRSFGHSVFPRGAMLSGHLQDYKDPGHFVGKGWLQLEFDRIILPGAQEMPLTAKIITAPHMKVDKHGDIRGKGHPTRDAVEWMIPPLWPIKVVTLPARGPYPTLKGETRVSLRLMDDIELPFPTARNSVPMPPWANPSSYGYSGALASPEPVLRPSAIVQPASYSPSPAAPAVDKSGSTPPTTVIALRGGAAYLARQYWIQNGQMHCVSVSGAEQSLPVEKIDIGETVRINQERNVDFVLQSHDVIEQIN
jgi:hypothetical protein